MNMDAREQLHWEQVSVKVFLTHKIFAQILKAFFCKNFHLQCEHMLHNKFASTKFRISCHFLETCLMCKVCNELVSNPVRQKLRLLPTLSCSTLESGHHHVSLYGLTEAPPICCSNLLSATSSQSEDELRGCAEAQDHRWTRAAHTLLSCCWSPNPPHQLTWWQKAKQSKQASRWGTRDYCSPDIKMFTARVKRNSDSAFMGAY